MTLACVIAAAIIFIAGLFAVIVERTNERDFARWNAEQIARQLDQAREDNADLIAALAESTAGSAARSVANVHYLHPVSDDDWFARLYDEKGNPR